MPPTPLIRLDACNSILGRHLRLLSALPSMHRGRFFPRHHSCVSIGSNSDQLPSRLLNIPPSCLQTSLCPGGYSANALHAFSRSLISTLTKVGHLRIGRFMHCRLPLCFLNPVLLRARCCGS